MTDRLFKLARELFISRAKTAGEREDLGKMWDTRHILPLEYKEAVNTCFNQAKAVIFLEDEELDRLRKAAQLLLNIPIQTGASALEPWVKINLIDITKINEVAAGITDPDEWVNEPCKNITGIGLGEKEYEFEHSSHWWSEYHDDARHPEPLRTPHWCDGKKLTEL